MAQINYFEEVTEVTMNNVLMEIESILSDRDCGDIPDEMATVRILNTVRPRATWHKEAHGNWCFNYICSACYGGYVTTKTAYCPDCGALMEE